MINNHTDKKDQVKIDTLVYILNALLGFIFYQYSKLLFFIGRNCDLKLKIQLNLIKKEKRNQPLVPQFIVKVKFVDIVMLKVTNRSIIRI